MYVSPIANDILAGHLINYGAVSFMTDSPMRLKSDSSRRSTSTTAR